MLIRKDVQTKWQRVKKAYDVLSNVALKEMYDLGRLPKQFEGLGTTSVVSRGLNVELQARKIRGEVEAARKKAQEDRKSVV